MELDHQNITFDPFWALNPHIYGIFAIVVFWCFRLPSFESIKSLSWMDLDPPKTYLFSPFDLWILTFTAFFDSCLLMFSTVGGQNGSQSDALERNQKRVEKVNIRQKWPKRAQKGPEGVHKGYRFCHFGSLFIVKVTPLVKAVTKGSKLSKMGPKRVQKGPKRVPPRPPFWRS